MASTFDELFCLHYDVPLSAFSSELLRRSLYPAARWLAPLLRCVDRNFFALDHELVARVARVTRLREFVIETVEFAHHPANDRFLRRRLHLRLSVGRLQDLAYRIMVEQKEERFPFPETAPSTSSPYGG